MQQITEFLLEIMPVVEHVPQARKILYILEPGFVYNLPDIAVAPGIDFIIFSAPFDKLWENIRKRISFLDVLCRDAGKFSVFGVDFFDEGGVYEFAEASYLLVFIIQFDSADLNDFLCADLAFAAEAVGYGVHFQINEYFMHGFSL